MRDDLVIYNGRAVLPGQVLEGALVRIRDGCIVEVRRGSLPGVGQAGHSIDAGGAYILPGLVDLHSDAIEREIEPRPRAVFPVEVAFRELEKRLAGSGITTIFHSLSFATEQMGLRSNETAAEVIRQLRKLAAGPALIRHRIHLRYEITDLSAVPVITALLEEGAVDLLSFMDHTPGQGQFRQLERYKEWVQATYGLNEEEFPALLAKKQVDRTTVLEGIQLLAGKALALGIPLASHDDDSAGRVETARSLGVSISEFPVNREAAGRARELGMAVCVGAPNVVRGCSQAGNLSAVEAIETGAAGILCSDYYPPAMLGAVFRLAGRIGLAAAAQLVSLRPAGAVGLAGSAGSLEPGRRADMVLVRGEGDAPAVQATVVDGRVVYTLSYRKCIN